MDNGSIDAEDMKLSVAKLLKGRLLPRTTHALYVDSPESVRINLSSVLDSLWNDRTFKSMGDGTWCVGVGNRQEKTPLQKAMMVGPVWEPMFADMLRESGLPVEQQRHECGYYLDIAIVNGDRKLNVEVDGRQHRILPSQRKKDIVRDMRLKATGWKIVRVPVSDLISDEEGCLKTVINIWSEMKGGTL